MTIKIDRTGPGPSTAWVVCDGCGTSPEASAILRGGGIINMGWEKRGTTEHYCPACKEEKTND